MADSTNPERPPLPDWDQLEFSYRRTDWYYSVQGERGGEPIWSEDQWRQGGVLEFSPAAAFLSYGLGIFEGTKARRTSDGRVLLFRLDANARRFERSAERLAMVPFPADRFVEAVVELVRRNERFVPPFGRGSLYIRPMQWATEPRLGLAVCDQFRVVMYCCPVGSYFKNGASAAGVRLKVLPQGRVAPGGTGAAKAMGNYAGAIQIAAPWRAKGFNDVLFLDAVSGKYVTETSGSNPFFVLDDGTLVTPPLDDQVLAGVTRDSTLQLARHEGLAVEERSITIDEVHSRAVEMFCTGTAWTLLSVTQIEWQEQAKTFDQTATRDLLYGKLAGIQNGSAPDPFGWTIDATAGAPATRAL